MAVESNLDGLLRFSSNIQENILEGLKKAGQHIHDLAKQLAPEDSGQLKESGSVDVISHNVVEISFGNDLTDNRAWAQEFGTYNSPAQPYLIPAAMNIDAAKEVADKLL